MSVQKIVNNESQMKNEDLPWMVCSTEQSADIIFVEFPGYLKVDLKNAREIVSKRLDFTENKKHYLVIDISKVRHVSPEAKEFMQRPDAGLKNILGAALIASNPVSALIANIFIKTPKNFEARFFSNKKSAMEWIYSQRKKTVDLSA